MTQHLGPIEFTSPFPEINEEVKARMYNILVSECNFTPERATLAVEGFLELEDSVHELIMKFATRGLVKTVDKVAPVLNEEDGTILERLRNTAIVIFPQQDH